MEQMEAGLETVELTSSSTNSSEQDSIQAGVDTYSKQSGEERSSNDPSSIQQSNSNEEMQSSQQPRNENLESEQLESDSFTKYTNLEETAAL